MRSSTSRKSRFWSRADKSDEPGLTTIFFATDLHGSEVCFRKFVNAAEVYGAQTLILGGDITGKFVVPLVEQADGGYRAELHGTSSHVPATDIERFERSIADQGLYAQRMTQDEHDHYSVNPEATDELFDRLMTERLVHWMKWSNEKLDGTEIQIMCAPGNDDPYFVDDLIRGNEGDRWLLVEGEVIELAPDHEMLNVGYSNLTPWNTHRELTEVELGARIDEMAERLGKPSTAIFNIHVPPFDSGLDTAPSLNEDFSVKTSAGAQLSAPAGSTAVRESIEKYQPLLSLHGHIHEAGGTTQIGRTLAINAGSEYSDGRLRGALFSLGEGKIIRYQLTTG